MNRPLRSAVLIFFLAAVAPVSAPRSAAFDPSPYLGTRWYGVYLFEEKVGYGSLRVGETEHRSQPAYLSEFRVDYRLNIGGSRQEMSLLEKKVYVPGEGLAAFSTLQDSPLGRITFNGRRDGEQFLVETPTGKRTAPAGEETLPGALAHLELVRNNPRVGDTVTARLFETTLLIPVNVTHTVEEIEERFPGGVSLKFYRVRSEFPELGITTTSLIDGQLRTREASLGIITIREEEESAARDLDSPGDLLLSAAVRPDRPLPRPREVRSVSLKLSGIPDPAPDLTAPGQVARPSGEETYYITISVTPEETGPAPTLPITGPAFAEELEATAYIQADHPAIKSRARKIVGDEKDPRRAAGLLTAWVFENLEKSFLAAIPNAVDVLEKGTGDCKAHSVLLVALARAAGLPARTVTGLVAMDDGLFYYHQWAELYTGEWTPVDPTFNQIPADAARVTLGRAGPAEHLRLLNLIGRISIEILDWGMGPRKVPPAPRGKNGSSEQCCDH